MIDDAVGSSGRKHFHVTLCILSFNQERYVGDALKAALCQTGGPIEIIVSDDGSSDSTLQQAQIVAAAYRGPHRIVIRQTAHNLGTLQHLFDVAEGANGDLLIVSAADDISLPDRVQSLVAAWHHQESDALFSGYKIIDAAGAMIEPFYHFDDRRLPIHDYLPKAGMISIHGASSAYRREALLALPRPSARILFDDTWLSLMLALLGRKVTYLHEPLVAYRRHENSTTNFTVGEVGQAAIENSDAQGRRRAAAYRDAIASFRHEGLLLGSRDLMAMDVIEQDLAFFDAQANWNHLSWFAKSVATIRARQPWMRRWALLRLMPLKLRVAISWMRGAAQRIRSR